MIIKKREERKYSNSHLFFKFGTNLKRSRKESTVCTTSGSPLEGSETVLDEFPGWMRAARAMPVNAAMTVVTV